MHPIKHVKKKFGQTSEVQYRQATVYLYNSAVKVNGTQGERIVFLLVKA